VLHVDSVSGRDLRPDQLGGVRDGLETWCRNAQGLLAALDERIVNTRKRAEDDKERDALFQGSLDKAYYDVRKDAAKRGKAYLGRYEDRQE
jgi:COP9 signalosome complex subunit 7